MRRQARKTPAALPITVSAATGKILAGEEILALLDSLFGTETGWKARRPTLANCRRLAERLNEHLSPLKRKQWHLYDEALQAAGIFHQAVEKWVDLYPDAWEPWPQIKDLLDQIASAAVSSQTSKGGRKEEAWHPTARALSDLVRTEFGWHQKEKGTRAPGEIRVLKETNPDSWIAIFGAELVNRLFIRKGGTRLTITADAFALAVRNRNRGRTKQLTFEDRYPHAARIVPNPIVGDQTRPIGNVKRPK